MQGYILKTARAKNEDLIVTVLTKRHLFTLYRFYGARHSILNLGYKIDFETEYSSKAYLPRLRHITHLNFSWLKESNRTMIWQQFVSRLHRHLEQLYEVDGFYFDMLENAASLWGKQNPKRTAIQFYVKLLHHEGRIHPLNKCFICEGKIDKDLTLIRAFLPAHPRCVAGAETISKEGAEFLFANKRTLLLEEEEIEYLWSLLLEGF